LLNACLSYQLRSSLWGAEKCGIGLASALPETWLGHLISMAEDDPKMILVRLAKEEGVDISAGAHFTGVKSAMLIDLTSVVAKVEAVGLQGYVTELALLENRFQFKRYIEKLDKS
jgi:sulfopyruvate decarboxylase TPP-binding subunit